VKIAREIGFDGVIVSSHGGRQLDYAVPPLRMLPEVLAESGGMAVMLDGGIRRATDAIKALALGAHFVFLGRPFMYAVAVAGEEGVSHAIRIMQQELNTDMALLGAESIAQLNPALLVPAG
jgi:L-lactate dehydrogenase (cytochrome)